MEGTLFDPAVVARIDAERAKRKADHDFVVTLGSGLSFEEALAKAKQDAKAKKLYLRGWLKHPADPSIYYRPTSDGGFESKPEVALEKQWPSVDLCESPIEVAYYEGIVGREIFGYKLRLQEEVMCGSAAAFKYRIDFIFIHPQMQTVCVEIDGHAYHERTKEQARSDKQRDRRLMLLGWRVLHFTGSEIFQSAEGCALETLQHLETIAHG